MMNWFKGKSLKDHLRDTKTVRVNGVSFKIKKLNPLDHLSGQKVMLQLFDIYKTKGEKAATSEANLKKLQEHYTDVFMSGVVKPVLCRKEESGEDIWVGELLKDWDLCESLYSVIYEHTYGKKKFRQALSLGQSS